MNGPDILARSLTLANIRDNYSNSWQYHSQSDNHSKIACWAVLFDLLQVCPLLIQHIEAGKVGFGINHEMHDFRTGRKKNLDLVLCTPGTATGKRSDTFALQAKRYSVDLTANESTKLAALPVLNRCSVGSVHVALEAKACMTEHIKALPRLYDELNSSHLAIHGSADFAIAAGLAVVNIAGSFISPGRNKHDLSTQPAQRTLHKQPSATIRTIDKLLEIPRRTQQGAEGFDAFGILVLEMANDGSAAKIVATTPAPAAQNVVNYDQMVRRIASLYATKFGNV
jgi:hypothetical protein